MLTSQVPFIEVHEEVQVPVVPLTMRHRSEQHSAFAVQLVPSPTHAVAWQYRKSELQWPLQQTPSDMHVLSGSRSRMHPRAAHLPPTHTSLQQSSPLVHAAPPSAHGRVSHQPLRPQ